MSKIIFPPEQDEYLYDLYGDFPMETEKTVVSPYPSTELVELFFSETPNFGKSVSCSFPIDPEEKRDLVNIYLHIRCQDPKNHLKSLHDIIHTIYLLNGDKIIQCYSGSFLELYAQLERRIMVPTPGTNDLWIPIPITLHQTSPFPIHYLKKHGFKIKIEFNYLQKDYQNVKMDSATIYAKYQFKPTRVELEKIDQVESIQYLMEKMSFSGNVVIKEPHELIRLYLTGPIKTLLWNFYLENKDGHRINFDKPIMKSAALKTNDRYLTPDLQASYYNTVIPSMFDSKELTGNPNLYVLTFSNHPSWARPTGSLNFTCLDNSYLQVTIDQDFWNQIPSGYLLFLGIYGIQYNVMDLSMENGIQFMFDC